MSQFKFALGASAALVTFLSLFAASSSAQNIQIPGAQAGGLSQGAALGGGAAGLGAMSAGAAPSIRSVDPTAVQSNLNNSNAANAALLMQPEQLKPNGGGSLKDQTNRVESQTNRIETTLQQHISGEKERTRILAIELKATNRRLAADVAATNARVDRLLQYGHEERVHISEQIVDHDAATTAIPKES